MQLNPYNNVPTSGVKPSQKSREGLVCYLLQRWGTLPTNRLDFRRIVWMFRAVQVNGIALETHYVAALSSLG